MHSPLPGHGPALLGAFSRVACTAQFGCSETVQAVGLDAFPITVSPGVAPWLAADGCEGDGTPAARLRGLVYDIPLETRMLPDFGALSAVEAVCLDRLDVTPRRSVYPGFPGLRDRFRWFAADLRGVVDVGNEGLFYFRLLPDDGARLYIDDAPVIDDDGYHPPRIASGMARVTAGPHAVHVEYWQGPGPIALVLEVASPGEGYHVLRMDRPL